MKIGIRLDKVAGGRIAKIMFSFVLALAIFLFCQASTMDIKSFSIDIEAKNADFFVPARWDFPKANIVARGKKGSLDNLSAADFKAFVDLSRCKSDGQASLPVEISVSEGALKINPLEISAKNSALKIQVEQKVEAEIPLYVQVEGECAEGFAVESWRSSPEKIKVFGTKSAIAKCGGKVPAFLDVSGRDKDFSVFADFSQSQPFCENVSVVFPQTVEISAKIAPRTIKKVFSNVPVAFANLAGSLSARQIVPLNVELEGAFPIVNSFKFSPQSVVADCSEILEPGEREVPVKIRLPEGVFAPESPRSIAAIFSESEKGRQD